MRLLLRRHACAPAVDSHALDVRPSQNGAGRRKTARLRRFVLSCCLVLATVCLLCVYVGHLLADVRDDGPTAAVGRSGAADQRGGGFERTGRGDNVSSLVACMRRTARDGVSPVSLIVVQDSVDARDGVAAVRGAAPATALARVFGGLVMGEETLCLQHPRRVTPPSESAASSPSRPAVELHRFTLHPVLVTAVAASEVEVMLRAAADAPPASGWAGPLGLNTSSEAVPEDETGRVWQAWHVPTAFLRAALGVEGGQDDAARCFHDSVTLVAPVEAAAASSGESERGEAMRRFVAAGLRTRAGRSGCAFVVLSSAVTPVLRADEAPSVEGMPKSEGGGGTVGFVQTLLEALAVHNEGRVGAVQCTILQRANPASRAERADGLSSAVLNQSQLSKYQVYDRGGWIASTTDFVHFLPFLSRRYSGYAAVDARVWLAEPIDAVSMHCGAFHRGLFDAVGGAAAMTPRRHNVSLARKPLREGRMPVSHRVLTGDGQPISVAPDRFGWVLTLREQQLFPAWRMWSSAATAVLRDREDVSATSSSLMSLTWVDSLQGASYALTNAYGQSVLDVIARLQLRRIGTPWRERRAARGVFGNSGQRSEDTESVAGRGEVAEVPKLPPVLIFSGDYPCACCGLNREAMSYIRPLMERYTVRMTDLHRRPSHALCSARSNVLLDVAYGQRDNAVFGKLSTDESAFWAAQYRRQKKIAILHMRAYRFRSTMQLLMKNNVEIFVGRSLSEFSQLLSSWLPALRDRRYGTTTPNELWVTADFFRDMYIRQGADAQHVRTIGEAVDVHTYVPLPELYSGAALARVLPPRKKITVNNHPEISLAEVRSRYKFLSTFKWEERKGWDVLLAAYWQAFGPSAPPELQNRTTLIIKTDFKGKYARGTSMENIWLRIAERMKRMGLSIDFTDSQQYAPHVVITHDFLRDEEIVDLYASVDAFVLPTRGEGWGLPITEAMSMGLPSIVTRWGGVMGFASADTNYLIEIDDEEEIPSNYEYDYEPGIMWAVPSINSTVELMRYAMQHPAQARELGHRARRRMIDLYSEEAIGDIMDHRLASLLGMA